MANSGNHGTKGKTKKFNYDPEMGLMTEIEKLTSASGKAVKSTAHLEKDPPTSNRNWKSVNTQYCIVCREGGELLCCDACPASFHLICHEPVIHRDQIPEGKWLCNRCKNTPSSDLQSKNSYDPNESEEERNRRAFVRAMVGKDAENDPLSMLAGAALAVNAQMFQLPSSYGMDEPMPFDEMRPSRQPVYGEQCWFCQKIVPDMVLTRCDFCPGIYHLDCLDPPLCSIPKDKWMCPNHAELVVDQKLQKSQSRTERMNLWKKYARQEVNEVAILRKFVTKLEVEKQKNCKRSNGVASTSNPKSRNHDKPSTSKMTAPVVKNNTDVRKTVEVHSALKDMYKDRWDGGDQRLQFATDYERDNWVNTIAGMHADCVSARVLSGGGGRRNVAPEIIAVKKRSPLKRKMPKAADELRTDICATMRYLVDTIVKQLDGSKKGANYGASTSSLTSSERIINVDDMVKEEPMVCHGIVSSLNKRRNLNIHAALLHSEDIKIEEEMPCSSSTTEVKMNGSLLNGFNHEHNLHEVQKEETALSEKDRSRNNLLEECKKRLLEAKTPLDRQIAALAVERLEQVERCATVVKKSSTSKRTEEKPTFNTRFFMPDKPIIAVLKAENDALPFAIQRSVTSIGTSEDCHVLLSGKKGEHGCAVQALHHVTILFDRVSTRFQLIPFNRNRVCVDGIWYGSELPTPSLNCSCVPLQADGTPKRAIQDQPVHLSHGSTITIGCTKFLFASFY